MFSLITLSIPSPSNLDASQFWSYPALVEYLGLGFQACEGTRRNGSTPVTSVYGLWVINFLYLQQFVERAEGVLEASKRLPTQFVLK